MDHLTATVTMPRLAQFRKLALALDPAARQMRAELKELARLLSPAERVLDLGSGASPYAGLFRYRRYVTADLLSMADVRCDARGLPFADKVFDLVLCTEVLEHVPHPGVALREIRRTLAENGALVLTTPLTWGVHDKCDFHRWTDSGLRQLLTEHGLTVARMRPRGGVFVCLGAQLLVIPWQVFGEAVSRTRWQSVLFAAAYCVLLVPALLLATLDFLDRRKHFTHGYVALCHRSAK